MENAGPLPLPYLTLIDISGPLFTPEPGKFVVRFGPWERRRLAYRIEGQSRGEYAVGPIMISGSDPLGMFPWKKRLNEMGRLIIYPEVLPIDRPVKTGLPAGNLRVESRIYEDVTRYRSLREYVPGDDARRISWKVSAKTGRLYSMEYLPALFSPVLVLLNLNAEEFPLRFRSHWIERSIVTAASLVMHAVSLGQEVGMVASASFKGEEASPIARLSDAPGHATAIMEMLARIDAAQGSADFTRMLAITAIDIPVGTRIEAITPRVTEEQHALLREGKQKGWVIEFFLVGGDLLQREESLSKEFPVFTVAEYGNELLSR